MKGVAKRALARGHAVAGRRRLETPAASDRDGLGAGARRVAGMAFLSGGENHHDLALLEVGAAAAAADVRRAGRQAGRHPLAFECGDALRGLRDQPAAPGAAVAGQTDQRLDQSLQCRDSDGIPTECRVEAAAIVRRGQAVARAGAPGLWPHQRALSISHSSRRAISRLRAG